MIFPLELRRILRQLASLSYDALLLVALWILASFLFVAGLHLAHLGPNTQSPRIKPVFQAYLLLVAGAYFTWFWRHGGQTPAMKAWRLRVERREGGRVGFAQAWIRFAVAAVLALGGLGLAWAPPHLGMPWRLILLFAVGGLGLTWALLDPDRQCLQDRLARTRVVFTPRPAKARPEPPLAKHETP
ncbi:MAG: RDD family protein [Betaproteobacteria bacterium]|nr:RDD family protein [Betaproteobacteria bacterium]